MIDTDKYEGHTPAPWNITVSVFKGKYILEETTDLTDPNEVCLNADLMQDAPLLLAEVKRLREALITVQQSLVWDEKDRAMDGDPITLEALVAQVEEVRSDITEMIE